MHFRKLHYCMVEISRSPFSHELGSADVFLFPKMKTALGGRRFEDVEGIKGT